MGNEIQENGPMTRRCQSLIDAWIDYTDHTEAPKIFRTFAAISMIGAASERRIWTHLQGLPALFPNMFIILVAAPGSNKGVTITPVLQMLRSMKDLKVAPKTMTKAALVDTVNESLRIVNCGVDGMLEYHSLQICSTEFGNLCPAYDFVTMNVLNELFDCEDVFDERTRGGGIIPISNPQVSILAGTQPDYLAAIMTDQAWGMGFTSRTILIFAEKGPPKSLFNYPKPPPGLRADIAHDLHQITKLHGEFGWTTEAADALNEWHMAGGPPVPEIARLRHYVSRRTAHLTKMMCISSLARSNDLAIIKDDFTIALDWMLEAEKVMPEIFRAMTVTGDAAIQEDALQYLKEKEPFSEAQAKNYLRHKVDARDLNATWKALEGSNRFASVGLDSEGKPTYKVASDKDRPAIPKQFSYKPKTPSPSMYAPKMNGGPVVPARYIIRVPKEEDEYEPQEEEEDYEP